MGQLGLYLKGLVFIGLIPGDQAHQPQNQHLRLQLKERKVLLILQHLHLPLRLPHLLQVLLARHQKLQNQQKQLVSNS